MPRRSEGFIKSVSLSLPLKSRTDYPLAIPAIRQLDVLPLDPALTFFVGDNGSGKSTLIEAIAAAAGLNPEGGSSNFRFAVRPSESGLAEHLTLVRGHEKARTDFFLRAETLFNVATEIELLDAEPGGGPPIIDSYGGTSLHEQSHGESFISIVCSRFGSNGLYFLDEPESALSAQGQLALLYRVTELVDQGCQFVIATHSPLLTALPGALLYQFSSAGIEEVSYDDAAHVLLYRTFLNDPGRVLHHLLDHGDDT